MADLIRFVDSIDAAPTVRLDLNDEVSFWVRSFSAPPPRLRRSMASNAMRDGIHVGSAAYDGRTLTMEIELRRSGQDAAATDIQNLWRELDRESNWIMYQPQGASKPVFFRTFRSDASALEDVMAQAAMRRVTVEVLAEPFALGLRETLGPFTVTNDPAAASNGCYFDLSTILGDVPAPLVLWDDATSDAGRYLTSTHATTAIPLTFAQAESLTLGTDTTNPGGGPDAAMSGTGTNNYVRTSFATAETEQVRLTWTAPATAIGSFKVLAFVRFSASTGSSCSLSFGLDSVGGAPGPAASTSVTISDTLGTTRQVVDLGLVDLLQGIDPTPGYSSAANPVSTITLYLHASRSGGTSSLDWDAIVLLPVGGQSGEMATPQTMVVEDLGANPVIDAVLETTVGRSVAGDPTTGAATFLRRSSGRVVGGFPYAHPDAANRMFLIRREATGASAVATSTTVTGAYWPRYLHVRPTAS